MATSAFGKAFRAAREAGDKEFEFGGKKYNTKLKEETSAPAPVNASRSMAAPVNASRYVSPNDREMYKAQERADQGLNEDASGFLDSNKGRKTYEESGKGTVDRQDATRAKPQKLPEPMPYSEFMKQQSMKHGGSVKKMASGGSASSRADGIAQRGKTRGTMVMCGGGMAKGKR